jgi:hypothetical protein
VSFAAISLRVASQRVFIIAVIYFVILSPETFGYPLVHCNTTRCHNSEDPNLKHHHNESPKTRTGVQTVQLNEQKILHFSVENVNII